MVAAVSNEMQALAGVTVLDIGGSVATGYCGKLFADHGARVVDIEPLRGAATRGLAPFNGHAQAPEHSALHAYLSANKRSVALDVNHPEGRDLLLRLARDAQVVLAAGISDRQVVAIDELATVAPGAVLSCISWFGDSGPYKEFSGSDGVCHALIGLVRGIGPEEGPPVMPAGYQAQIVGGLTAYIGTLGQVFAWELGNRDAPCRLDTSIFEANLCFTDVGAVGFSYSGVAGRRMGVNRFPPTFPLGIYPCKDGWIGVTALTPSQWRAFCALLDLNHLVDFASYQTTLGRLADAAYLEPIIMQRVAAQSAQELFNRGQRMRIPLALVPTMEQLLRVDQYVERGAFAAVTHPAQGSFAAPVTPFRLYRTPAIAGGAAPSLGANTRECLLACGVEAARIDAFAAQRVIGER